MNRQPPKRPKAPAALTGSPYHQRDIQLDGITVIESCTHTRHTWGSLYLDEHLLVFVERGTYGIRHGNERYTLGRNEFVLLQKAIVVDYEKSGDKEDNDKFDALLFFLADDFLTDFIRLADFSSQPVADSVPVSVRSATDQLLGFVQSLKPYFADASGMQRGLVKLKLLELLYDLASADAGLLHQLLQLQKTYPTPIPAVMEENYLNPVSVSDLAYLSGRSLSSFKRDFRALYHETPAHWIQKRRLDKAKELLLTTRLSVTDVCYETGFESVAHFSRTFKKYTGCLPSSLRPALAIGEAALPISS